MAEVAPTPAPPQEDAPVEEVIDRWLPAEFRNPAGAPVVIVSARTPVLVHPGRTTTLLPEVEIENRTDRRVVALRIRYKADDRSHGVSGAQITIEPRGTVAFRRTKFDIPGTPERMRVQLLGVRFSDGSTWGTLDSRIDGRDEWVPPLEMEH